MNSASVSPAVTPLPTCLREARRRQGGTGIGWPSLHPSRRRERSIGSISYRSRLWAAGSWGQCRVRRRFETRGRVCTRGSGPREAAGKNREGPSSDATGREELVICTSKDVVEGALAQGLDSTTTDAIPGETKPGIEANQCAKTVPWTWELTVQVMLIWVLAFWVLGNWVVPLGLELFGLGPEDLTARGQAFMHLVVDLSELGVTLGILWLRLRAYRPLARGWFPFKWERGSWIPGVLLACLLFPVVDWLALHSQNIMPTDRDEWAASLEQSLSGGDLITNALYFVVVAICAPIWEEAIFRGFLLPSLHRYLPMAGAVLTSSVCFAMAHFSLQRFLPLVFLGIIMGTLYARSNNLLSCITLHSLWNLYIFYQLAVRGGI